MKDPLLISSADNDIYKGFLRLYKRKYRDRLGLYVIEGRKLIEEALKNGAVLRDIFLREDYSPEDIPRGDLEGVRICRLTRSLFDRAADTETPQGIAAVSERPEWTQDEFFQGDDNIIVLDRLQDPGNLGTIIRTADAAGFRKVLVLKGTADLFSPKTIRAAAGSLYRVRLLQADSPEEAADMLRERGFRIICTAPLGKKLIYQADMKRSAALVIGNEANGVCHSLLDMADETVRLPMEGNIESLNAGVAASVVMYESVRQRISEGSGIEA